MIELLIDANTWPRFKFTQTQVDILVPHYSITRPLDTLTHINGISIGELEQKMRPGVDSRSGFIGHNEKLIELLKADDELTRTLGFTCSQVVFPYFLATKAFFNHQWGFWLNDLPYVLGARIYGGKQYSPLNDGTYTRTELIINNITDPQPLDVSLLTIQMAAQIGFFGGKKVCHRIDPQATVDFFHLT